MKPEDLTPGVYRLTRDVPAPLKDKRVKHEWWYLPCESGMSFIVCDDRTDRREIYAMRGYMHHSFSVKDFAVAELIAALERVERPSATQHLKLRWRENSAGALLNMLVADGKLTLDEIDVMLKRDDEEEES